MKNTLTPDEAYKKGYEDGFEAGAAATVYEIELEDEFNELPLEERTRIMLQEMVTKHDKMN